MTDHKLPPKPIISDDLIRSFGRLRSRTLSNEQKDLMEHGYPAIAVDMERLSQPESLFDIKISGLCLEIGFGGGEHLTGYAAENPDTGCIGCEPFINGVASCVKHVQEGAIVNVRLLNGDARLLLERLPDDCLDKVFILFPDPWPKNRHHRKRIVCHATLDILATKMKPGAILEVATDHVDYGIWIAEHLDARKDFMETDVTKNKRDAPPPDWIRTRYQEKAEAQGRGAKFFVFRRN